MAFDHRHGACGVRACAVHPGGIKTELGRHMDESLFESLIKRIDAALAAQGQPPFKFKTVPQGAATSIWATVVAASEAIGALLRELPCEYGRR